MEMSAAPMKVRAAAMITAAVITPSVPAAAVVTPAVIVASMPAASVPATAIIPAAAIESGRYNHAPASTVRHACAVHVTVVSGSAATGG